MVPFRLATFVGVVFVGVVLGVACVSTSGPREGRPPPAPHLERPPDPRTLLQLRDTVPAFLLNVRRTQRATPEELLFAWQQYENTHEELLRRSGALPRDPEDVELRQLVRNADAVVQLTQAFGKGTHTELADLVERMHAQLGQVPPVLVVFAVSRSPKPLFEGELDGKPLLLFNARAPELSEPPARRVAMARALSQVLHRQMVSDSPSLTPLAARVWREGASLLATRQLLPDAFEPQLLGLKEDQLSKLRTREPMLARELLASLDSSREAELARFFDPKVKDPLLPRGAGPYLADRLFQRLAAELGSGVKPLRLSAGEFLARARTHVSAMAAAKP